MKPSVPTYKVGVWVCWHTSEGYKHIGKVVGNPEPNREGDFVYPIEQMNGAKTAISGNKLTPIPYTRDGQISEKRRKALEVECTNYNEEVVKRKSQGNGSSIPPDLLVKQQQKELEDLRGKLSTANTNIENLEKANKELADQAESYFLEKNKCEEELAKLSATFSIPNSVLEDAIANLQIIVDDLLKDARAEGNEVVRKLLPVIYKLVAGK